MVVGCGSDKLRPVSNYNGTDCEKDNSCGEGNLKLDGGHLGADVGTTPPVTLDAGTGPTGDTDSGVLLDAGVLPDSGPTPMDAGAQDSGTPPMPSQFLNIAGTWHTRYSFDLSQYLFGISGIAGQLDTINQILMGHINTGFPPLDALIAQIIMMYIPSWVGTLVNALDTIANLFKDVRVNGGLLNVAEDLPLTPTAETTAIHANETWTELVVMIIDQCPLGQNDPNYPTCAEHHIPVTHNPQNVGPVTVLVTLPPFDGTLNAGVPAADFVFHPREVQLEMRKLILLIVNTVVSLVTPYPDLMTALQAIIDCNGLGQQAVALAENPPLSLPAVVAIGIGVTVTNQCNDAINQVVGGVGNIGINWEAMDFDQHGHAVDTSQPPDNRADILQQWSTPNTIDGHFKFAIQSHMGGNWEGLP
jgi:hypothetical protein